MGLAGVVLARAVIIDRTVDATASARLFQIMMIIGGLAPALAPMVGTGIVAFAGWRTVFVVVGLLSLLSFIGIITYIPESLPPEKRTGQGMSALWAGMRSVLGNRIYVGYTLTTSFSFMVMFAYIAASPFVFQNVLGLDPVQYALAFGVNAVGIALVSAVSAKLVGRFSPTSARQLRNGADAGCGSRHFHRCPGPGRGPVHAPRHLRDRGVGRA